MIFVVERRESGVASLLERITRMRAEMQEQAAILRKQLADVEAELARVEAAEQVVTRLLAEEQAAPHPTPTDNATDPGDPARPIGVVTVPHRQPPSQTTDLPATYRQLIAVAEHARGPVRCKDVCTALGMEPAPRHIETIRSKLKRLAARGWMSEDEPGLFTLQ